MKRRKTDKLRSALVKVSGQLMRTQPSPDEELGELFVDVQNQQVYNDGKTFVDLVPKRRMKHIRQEYLLEKQDPNFNLQEFVSKHFHAPDSKESNYQTDRTMTMRQHISTLWDELGRSNYKDHGSLIALPHPYVVPGGRFSEQFYWDSYFIMLGLARDGRWDNIDGMMRNYAYMIRKIGFIPTANRTYFLSRSQPPFFSHMVELLAEKKGQRAIIEYLPYLVAEHNFWMKGKKKLLKSGEQAYRRVVKMPNGALLNRYFDDKVTPRPESMREDMSTASETKDHRTERLFLDLRAAAESGWDFSSRWMDDSSSLRSIRTTNIVPVDLNSLMYHLERTISKGYKLLKNTASSHKYALYAERRARAIQEYCWDDKTKFFVDYDLEKNTASQVLSLAAMFPLYEHIATTSQAKTVARKLEQDFLQKGGLVTTLNNNGQQWDSPNGWAPLQWVAIQGLRNYGYDDLTNEIKQRWLKVNQAVFESEGKMIEKYDVVNQSGVGGGGEYPLQDGFGWTNGVAACLADED